MNEKIGFVATIREIGWNESEDLEYYTDIHGDDHDELERHEYLLSVIKENLEWCNESLMEVFRVFGPGWVEERADSIALLSLQGKLTLLRHLIPETRTDLPPGQRSEVLSQLNYVLNSYDEAERFRERVLARYIVNPKQVWLRELVDVSDKTVVAAMDAEELIGWSSDWTKAGPV